VASNLHSTESLDHERSFLPTTPSPPQCDDVEEIGCRLHHRPAALQKEQCCQMTCVQHLAENRCVYGG
jgi:hypothetical protein